ncbi:MAG: magnesium transporter [Flavobacteriales bacterium]|nr:magnesium transporter [Flavobacteriales bacterium]
MVELTKEYIEHIQERLETENTEELITEFENLHPADAAEIMEELKETEAAAFYQLFDEERSADILMELEEETRAKVVRHLSTHEIANEILYNLDSDDAADFIAELDDDVKERVIDEIQDIEHAKTIVDLLNYPEDTAGGLMAKELIKVNENWSVLTCVRKMRRQAEEIEEVHAVYVVDDDDRLKGTLSLKKLLTNSTRTKVKELYNPAVISVKASADDEAVAIIMQKYDLVVLPVVDELGRLLGRITVDDVLDVMKEEAERDYQMASGISESVEQSDDLFRITRARLPWLLVGMFGGVVAAQMLDLFSLEENGTMGLFIPLIAAMGGNVGVQSAAIIVQSLANESIKRGTIGNKLAKELGVGLLNGAIISVLVFGISQILGWEIMLATTVSIALFAVIIFAALFGTFVPLALDKYNIDPALATGPFITTTNDVIGLCIYFGIGKLILGF